MENNSSKTGSVKPTIIQSMDMYKSKTGMDVMKATMAPKHVRTEVDEIIDKIPKDWVLRIRETIEGQKYLNKIDHNIRDESLIICLYNKMRAFNLMSCPDFKLRNFTGKMHQNDLKEYERILELDAQIMLVLGSTSVSDIFIKHIIQNIDGKHIDSILGTECKACESNIGQDYRVMLNGAENALNPAVNKLRECYKQKLCASCLSLYNMV